MEFIQKEIEELKKLLQLNNLLSKEILSVDDATQYLQISKSCLFKMTSKREIPFYKPGGKKIYFKRSEIDEWITSSKIESAQDLETEVELYIGRTKSI